MTWCHRDEKGLGYLLCRCWFSAWETPGTTAILLEESVNLLASKVRRFLVSEDGPTAVEYAVMLALIIVVCLAAITSIGTRASSTFNSVATQLGS